MYCRVNYKTKTALRKALQAGRTDLEIFAPGLGHPKRDGIETIEGPHYPEPHRWYARVEMRDGKIVRVVG